MYNLVKVIATKHFPLKFDLAPHRRSQKWIWITMHILPDQLSQDIYIYPYWQYWIYCHSPCSGPVVWSSTVASKGHKLVCTAHLFCFHPICCCGAIHQDIRSLKVVLCIRYIVDVFIMMPPLFVSDWCNHLFYLVIILNTYLMKTSL